MRKIIGLILLVVGLAMLFSPDKPPATTEEAYRASYIGQYMVNALFITAGLWLLLKKK